MHFRRPPARELIHSFDGSRSVTQDLRDLCPDPPLSRDDEHRLREIFSELARHGESHRLLQRTGVDEGELAEACDVVVRILDARIAARLSRDPVMKS